eukprot:3492990-Pyramimonas_sp.AAC.1
MHTVTYATAAFFVRIGARAVQMLGHDTERGEDEWLRGIRTHGDVTCEVQGECIVGSGLGTCTVMVDQAKALPMGSTDS